MSKGRSPHGERGLKSQYLYTLLAPLLSLSSRRAWIEILGTLTFSAASISRSPHGERGLKSGGYIAIYDRDGRSPHGERGLKC